ncbi:MAG: extracellular solute-binding protein, partial [Hyphomicrobiaceae bacterium]
LISRRSMLAGGGALLAAPIAARVVSAAPPAVTITSELVAAARKEGKVHWYSAMDLTMTERYARAFEAAYPGITVKVERSGAERVFSRIAQEYASHIHNVDIVNTTDAAHPYAWRKSGWLEAFVTSDVAEHFPADFKSADGHWATLRIVFSIIGYNTRLVKPEDAPKSFADLVDPRWSGRLVKAHPAYSGTVLTATHAMVRELGWDYFEKLAKLKVLQVQSGVDPPKKIALGERAAMVDGADYLLYQAREKGAPVEPVYPVEGAPIINSPNALFKAAPNPNAARLLLAWMYSAEGQQKLVDITGLYVPHAKVPAPQGRKPLASIKIMRDEPEAMLTEADALKKRYAELFKV